MAIPSVIICRIYSPTCYVQFTLCFVPAGDVVLLPGICGFPGNASQGNLLQTCLLVSKSGCKSVTGTVNNADQKGAGRDRKGERTPYGAFSSYQKILDVREPPGLPPYIELWPWSMPYGRTCCKSFWFWRMVV